VRLGRPAFVFTLAAALGCGGDAAGARADSASGTVAEAAAAPAATPGATPADSAAIAAPESAAAPAAVAAPLDSLRKVAHRHPALPRPAAGALSEEAVQGVIDAINASDAAVAAAAVRKATDAEVKRFATSLASAHPQKVTETPPLKNEAGALVAPLRAIQAQSTAKLGGMAPGASFDRAFIDAQITTHERARAVLDSIRPVAQSGDLPALVASTRAQVVRHLDQARALQRRLPP
jgi:putative membrane protein